MDKRESMWDVYLRKGMSRRSFVKGCVALTSLMGLSTDKLSKVVEAAEKKPLPVVIWIHGHECTGCDESFIRSGSPYASDVILSQVALEYDHLLSAASGEPFEAHLEETIQKYKGQYILAVEGAACTKDNGVYCMSGGHPFTHTLQRAAENAAAVIAYGTCAVSGGIQAANPNPTGSSGITNFTGKTPVVNVPGCPPIPEVMTGVIMHVALFGTVPPLDGQGRQAVGDDNGQVVALRVLGAVVAQALRRSSVQASPQVWALQVGMPVAGRAVQLQHWQPLAGQVLGQCLGVQRQVHGIARLGMGELEIQLRAGRQAGAGAPQGDARRGQAAQFLPGVVDGTAQWLVVFHRLFPCVAPAGCNRPTTCRAVATRELF